MERRRETSRSGERSYSDFASKLVQQRCAQYHRAENNKLFGIAEVQRVHAVLDDGNDKRSDQRAEYLAGASKQTCSPNDHGGDHVQLEHHSDRRRPGADSGCQDAATEPGRETADRVDEHDHVPDRHA